jgi:ribonuclease VapC
MSRVVLDASALLAILNNESGSEKLTPALLSTAVSSAVNLAEVQSKLVERGLSPDNAWRATLSPVQEVVAFTAAHAKVTASLIAETRAFGLSFGDRACLALALALKAPVYTADRAWRNLRLGIRIHIIR